MWISSDYLRGQSEVTLLLFLIILCCHAGDADLAKAALLDESQNSVTSEVRLPSTTTATGSECKNVTNNAGVDSGLSVISDESTQSQPIVPPTFLHEALTCKPFQGISINHPYFQLANFFFLLSNLPLSGLYGVLWLRCTQLVGCAFLALWGWTIICWIDAALWNALFVVINFIYVCALLYRLRPIKFSKEIEEVYIAVFQPLRVSRHQFKKVLSCMKVIRQLKHKEVYAQEKVTKVDSLSLVLSGKLVVSQNGRALHIVFPHQFLDSSEWFGVSTDEFFQVSITAIEESRILLWHRDKLKLSIISDQFLQAVFDHILGRDVVKKLMQVSETMAASMHQQQNGQAIGLGSGGNSEFDLETKLFVVKNKKTGDSQGITALISRQLQEERVPLLYSSSDVLNNALHRLENFHSPHVLSSYPTCNDVRSSRA